jgi:hypothetical protein
LEHDKGTPEEAEAKVRAVVQSIVSKFEQASGTLSSASVGSFVIPGWARDILIGWVPEAIAAIFGIGDDEVGRTPVVMFDHKDDLKNIRCSGKRPLVAARTAARPQCRHAARCWTTVDGRTACRTPTSYREVEREELRRVTKEE